MAFYTSDGIRHNTKEEALSHVEEYLLTELSPSEDELVQAIHKHDWGNFEVQCDSDSFVDSSVYTELTETIVDIDEESGEVTTSYNLLKYREALTYSPKKIERMEEKKRFVSMIGHEIRELLNELSEDDLYLYNNKVHEIDVTMDIYNSNLGTEESIYYSINSHDGTYSSFFHINPNEDTLQLILNSVKNQFLSVIEGRLINYDGEVSSQDDRYNGFNAMLIFENAMKTGKQISLSVSEPTQEA